MSAGTRTPVNDKTSLVLVKNLIRLSVSCVAYTRNLFPEECFENREYAGLLIKTLLRGSPEAKDTCSWLEEGVFDALEKKYMKTMVFAIYANDNSTPVESYSYGATRLDLAHNGKKVYTETPNTKRNVRSSCIQLIRTLVSLTSTLRELPNKYHIGLVLYYTDDAPPDYEPRHFEPAKDKDILRYRVKPLRMKLGRVNDGFHQLDVHMKTITDSLTATGEIPPFDPDDRFPLYDDDIMNNDPQTPRTPRQPPISTPSSQSSYGSQVDKSNASHDSTQQPTGDDDFLGSSPILNTSFSSQTSVELEEMYPKVKAAVLEASMPTLRFASEVFAEIPTDTMKDIFERMVSEGVLGRKNDRYIILDKQREEDRKVVGKLDSDMRAVLVDVLAGDTVTQTALRAKGYGSNVVSSLLEKMERLGFVEKQSGKKAREVIRSDRNKRILTLLKDIQNEETQDSQANASQGSQESQASSTLSQEFSDLGLRRENNAGSSNSKPPARPHQYKKRTAMDAYVASPTEEVRKKYDGKIQFMDSQDSEPKDGKASLVSKRTRSI